MAAVRARMLFLWAAVVAILLVSSAPPTRAENTTSGPLQGTGDWPMYGGSPAHTFSTATTPPTRLGLVWSLAGNANLGSAVEADGFVYVGDVDRAIPGPNVFVHKVVEGNGSIETGTAVRGWHTHVTVRDVTVLPAAVNLGAAGPPRSLAVTGGLVYGLFTARNATHAQEVLFALDADSGNFTETVRRNLVFNGTDVWASLAPEATQSAPVVAGGLVVFGSQDGYVYAVNQATLTLAWRYGIGIPIATVPAIRGSFVYVTAGTKLFWLDVAGCANGDGGVVEVGCTPANPTQGDLVQLVDVSLPPYGETGATIRASPVVAASLVYVDVSGDLFAINATVGGAPVWAQATLHESRGTPAPVDDLVLARRSDGLVYAYDRTGGLAWARGQLPAPSGGEDMATADARIFLSAQNGTSFDLVTLSAADGDVVDRNVTSPRAALGAPVVAGKKVLVAEGTRLLAYRGQPDLVPEKVEMNRGVVTAGVVRASLTVTVRNAGVEAAFGVHMRVYEGNPSVIGSVLLGTFTIGNASDPIKPNGLRSNATEERSWGVGRHDIYVVIVPAATEENTGNNVAAFPIFVQPGPAPPPTILGPGPLWAALLLGFAAGAGILVLPIYRLRELRRRETEPKPP